MTRNKRLSWLLATVSMFVANGLAFLPLNGQSTGALSDSLTTLITPAGFTFGIWSVIYTGLLIVLVGVLLGKIQLPPKTVMWYALSCLANASWIFAWHYQNLHLSQFLMLGILVSLIMVDQSMKPLASTMPFFSPTRSIFLIYLGWICIASLVSTTIYFMYQVPLLSGAFLVPAGIVGLSLACLINIGVLIKEKHIMTSLVAIRASRGIINSTRTNPAIITTSWIIIGVLVLGIVYTLYEKYKKTTLLK